MELTCRDNPRWQPLVGLFVGRERGIALGYLLTHSLQLSRAGIGLAIAFAELVRLYLELHAPEHHNYGLQHLLNKLTCWTERRYFGSAKACRFFRHSQWSSDHSPLFRRYSSFIRHTDQVSHENSSSGFEEFRKRCCHLTPSI